MGFWSTLSSFCDALATTDKAGEPQPTPSADRPGFFTTNGDGRSVFVSPTPGGVGLDSTDNNDPWG
jgi:hypothetical protein